MTEKIPVVDFHSHIVPRMDHGCSSSNECLKQLTLMREYGTDIAVATPHFYPHMHHAESFCRHVDSAINRMKELDVKQAPRLAIGAEVLLCEKLECLEGLHSLCIRGTDVMLLELPTKPLDDGHFDTVEVLLKEGYTVVLAHIDRYLNAGLDDILRLLDMGALAQINPLALSWNGPKKHITSILENTEDIVAIGSDLHGAKRAALNGFQALQKRLGEHHEKIQLRANKLLKDAEIITF